MTLNRWNPVRDLLTLREAMDQMESVRRGSQPSLTTWPLPMDAYVTDDAIVLEADVPGLKPDALDITLEGDTLTIRGELKPIAEDHKYLLRERPAGHFERTLTVNTPIDTGKVEANFDNGVVTIRLPKAEAAKPRQISIKPKMDAQIQASTSNGATNGAISK